MSDFRPGTIQTSDGPKEEELLMKDGSWELRAHNSSHFKLHSFIQHYCPTMEQKYYWYSIPLIDTICHGCNEYPSEKIMGLWKLHNMDYIQAGISH